MLFLVLSLAIIVVLSYVQASTKRSSGMEEYCKLECKGYKYWFRGWSYRDISGVRAVFQRNLVSKEPGAPTYQWRSRSPL